MDVFIVLSGIFSFVLGIIILIYYIINFHEVNSFIKYGLIVMAVYVISEFFAAGLKAFSVLMIITYVKIPIYTCIGMHVCSKLGAQDMPLLRRLLCCKGSNRIKIKAKHYILNTLFVIAGSAVFSYALFKLTSPSASENIKNLIESESNIIGTLKTSNLGLIFTMLGVAIAEELVFRFIFPNFLAHRFKLDGNKYWIAIIISSFFWTISHAGILNPEWVKFAQIFPIGLAFGWLCRKHGLESSIFAHAGFNIIMLFISAGMVKI